MENLFFAIQKYSAPRYEEDFVDRLNFHTTSLIFFVASSVIVYQSFFGQLLQCWTPVQFRGGWDEYTNDYCFVENTYFVPVTNRSLPDDDEIREEAKLPYYQWVPFVLALQAMCFCIPHIFWRMLNWISGVQVRAVVSMAVQAVNPLQGVKESTIKMIANHLTSGLKISREEHRYFGVSSNPVGCVTRSALNSAILYDFMHFVATTTNINLAESGILWHPEIAISEDEIQGAKNYGSFVTFTDVFTMLTLHAKCYITFCYFAMKGFFIANILLQLAIINFFLGIPGGDALTWGVGLLINLLRGNDWSSTGIFPRVTMCDFEIRELGNIHRWSVQCVLPLNMFSEKIYIVLWFWLHTMLVTTIINTIIWLFQILRDQNRMNFISEMLGTAKVMDDSFLDNTDFEKNLMQLYSDLGWDGILILRIIHSNAGEMACVCLVKELYKKYSVNENGAAAVPQLIDVTK